MSDMRIGPQDVGNFKSPEQKEAYQKAMALKNEAQSRADSVRSLDESGADARPGQGDVFVSRNEEKMRFSGVLKYDPDSSDIKKMKLNLEDDQGQRVYTMKAEHKKGIFGSEKDVYTYKEEDLVTGSLHKKAQFHKDGTIDYEEFRFHQPGAGYRPFAGKFPGIPPMDNPA